MYSLIVVDYNALDTTIEYICRCYDRLGMEGAGHTVIVENGSSEGTLERMRLRFGEPEELQIPEIPVALYLYRNAEQQICYCNSGANLGYAKGNNLGVNIAQAMWHDFGYIISNNDLVFEKDLDMKYINNLFHQNPAIGIVGPKVITPAGEIVCSPDALKEILLKLLKILIALLIKSLKELLHFIESLEIAKFSELIYRL